jgi:hypothetical protein
LNTLVFALPASPVRIVINGAKAPPGRHALIGTRFRIITGFNGTAEIALAMEARRGAGHQRLVVDLSVTSRIDLMAQSVRSILTGRPWRTAA